LKPIANSKYKEMNLLEDGGISKSLFTNVAIIPKRKNRRVGFERLVSRI
jgi:hypothetical protein